MNKLNRNYKLIIEGEKEGDPAIIITPPFSLEFTVTRKNFFSNNSGSFRIYNLGRDTRAKLQYNQTSNLGVFRKVTFLAGYGDNLSVAFYGDISVANSERNGTNFITNIECLDSGYALSTTQISKSYGPNISYRDIVMDVINELPGVTVGAIGDIGGKTLRSSSFNGKAGEVINELTGNAFFIDKGRAYVLSDSEAVAGKAVIIDSSSGLLGVPSREESFLTVDMIFEPKLFVGQKIRILADSNEQYNGDYRIDNISHKGTISPVLSGTCVTNIGCIFGDAFKEIREENFA